jgi:hypothetical protein
MPPLGGQDGNAAQVAAALAPRPAPSHEQTVAGLRHLAAVHDELVSIKNDRDLGNVDVKSKVVDGFTKLVADRIVDPGEAVAQLVDFPTKPLEQKEWVDQKLVMNLRAQSQLLDHHRASHVGTGEWAIESQTRRADPDDHRSHIGALLKHFKSGEG